MRSRAISSNLNRAQFSPESRREISRLAQACDSPCELNKNLVKAKSRSRLARAYVIFLLSVADVQYFDKTQYQRWIPLVIDL